MWEHRGWSETLRRPCASGRRVALERRPASLISAALALSTSWRTGGCCRHCRALPRAHRLASAVSCTVSAISRRRVVALSCLRVAVGRVRCRRLAETLFDTVRRLSTTTQYRRFLVELGVLQGWRSSDRFRLNTPSLAWDKHLVTVMNYRRRHGGSGVVPGNREAS